ncbi:MAG: hypothetical protein MUF61_01325 [archaeon]|jgi:hypothetical protein|nr:hypothetical protein [archaeon]
MKEARKLGILAIFVISSLLYAGFASATTLTTGTYCGAPGPLFTAGYYDSASAISCGFLEEGAVFSGNNIAINCQGNEIEGSGGAEFAMSVVNSNSNVSLYGCTLRDFTTYQLNLTNANNSRIWNSIFSGGTYGISLVRSSNITFINVSFSGQGVDSNSNYTRQWYLDVRVNWTNGTAVPGASITAFNSSFMTFTGTTNSDGKLTLNVTKETRVSGTTTDYKRYNVSAVKGVSANSTMVVMNNNNMTQILLPILTTPVLTTELVYPTVNMNVPQNKFFNITVNVTCNAAACGYVNVSLDPASVFVSEVEEIAPAGFFAKIWFYIVKAFKWTGHVITGLVAGSLVSTTTGATPFYTNMSNPLNSTNAAPIFFGCLNDMAIGSSCLVYWTVNATSSSGTYEFWAFANSTNVAADSIQSGHVNLTILAEDLQAPLIAPIAEFDPYYVAPVSQEWQGNFTFAANVTDNVNVSVVWLNVSNATGQYLIFPMVNISNDTYAVDVNASVFGFGTKSFWIYANDTSGLLINTSQQTFTITDLMVPVIANVSIMPTYPDPSTNVYINASIYDDYGLSSQWVEIVRPDGTSINYSMSNLAGNVYGYTYTTSQRGRYTVYIYANDTYGNLRTTRDIPRYFYVPPVVLSDSDLYTQKQTILITGFGFSFSENVQISIGNATANLTVFNTLSTGSGYISDSFVIPEGTAGGSYVIRAYDPGLGVTVFKNIKIEGIVIIYPAGSILIPGDDKQNPSAYDLDFLAMYGVLWNVLDNSYKADWVVTPECVRLNATNVDTNADYNEFFCHGFWLIKDDVSSALTYINSVRGSVQILTLNEEGRVPKAQVVQLSRAPKVAVLGGSQGQITSTLTRSDMPYTQLTDADVMNDATFNIGTYDILLIGDYDFSKASPSLAANISRFVNSGGYCHAEDDGAITLDAQTNFLGNLAEDGTYTGDIRIITPSNAITQVQLDVFSNSVGSASVLDISGATNPDYTVFLADANNPPATNVKLVGMTVGSGYVTYSGGHIGSSQGSSELGRPRNRILDNLLFFSTNVNDQSDPEVLNVTPMAASNVTQFRKINLSAIITDDAAVDSVRANISWAISSLVTPLSGPDIFSSYSYEFTNTTYVIDKNTLTRYNITFFANDSSGNTVNSSTYFYVIPDKIPRWSNNASLIVSSYNASQESLFNISWLDDFEVNLSNTFFESNFTGSFVNYTSTLTSGNASNGSHILSKVLPAGTFAWRAHSSDEYNQWNSTNLYYFTIQKASTITNLTLNDYQGNITAEAGSTINITARAVCPAPGNVLVYDDGVLIANETTCSNLTQYLLPGEHNITMVYAGSQNYSATSETHYIVIQDSVFPVIDYSIPTETSSSVLSRDNIIVNISVYDADFSNATIYLFNTTGLVNSTTLAGPLFYLNFDNLPDGVYYFNASAIDNSLNTNYTLTRTVIIDTLAPNVVINDPDNSTQYNSSSVGVNVTLNEAGACIYSLDNGISNTTLTTSDNTTFTAGLAMSNGNYTMDVYCRDIAGNWNLSQEVSFTVLAPYCGDGTCNGGESCSSCSSDCGSCDSGCTDSTWTCGDWGNCTGGTRTRQCISNCDNTKTESEECSVCTDECSEASTYCAGNIIKECKKNSEGCYKIYTKEECGANYTCKDAVCVYTYVEVEKPLPVEEDEEEKTVEKSSSYGGKAWNWTIQKPSEYIPHGDIPAPVVDWGVATVATGAGISIIWVILLWIAGMLAPLFLIRLKHYIVFVMDSKNKLQMFKDGQLDRKRLHELVNLVDSDFEKLSFADKSEDMVRYLVKSGFVEARLDEPFIVAAHFTSGRNARRYKESLRKIMVKLLGKHEGEKIEIAVNVERASIIGAIRAYFRKRKSEKEAEKLFKK